MIGRPHGAAAIAVALCGACGGDVARMELVIAGCGQDESAARLTVTGLAESGAFAEELGVGDGEVRLGGFPPDLRQITVEARNLNPGDIVVHGKSAPFEVDSAPAQIPILIAPVDGMCPTGALGMPRRHPRVYPIGTGALVFGGLSGDVASPQSVDMVERYDPATGAFVTAGVLGAGANAGGAATLTDGRIVVLGGADGGYAFYDPIAGQLGNTFFLFARPYATVIGLDDHRILIAGGCAQVDVDRVSCLAGLSAATIYDVDEQEAEDLPDLQVVRADGLAVFVPGPGGRRDVALVGGFDPTTRAPVTEVEVIALDGSGTVARIPDAAGAAAVLDTGAVLAALAPPGAPGANTTAVYVPGLTPARPTFAAPRIRRDAVVVGLEDGTALAIGGFDEGTPDTPGTALLFKPLDGWRLFGGPPAAALIEHAAARLADGSVLVVGGRDAATDAALATAWRFRPSLLGPFAGGARATPGSGIEVQLTALDPTLIDRTGGGYVLLAMGGVDNHAVVGGPRFARGAVEATVTLETGGGVSLIARATGAGDRLEAILEPGRPAVVVRWTAGVRSTICTGTEPAPALAGTTFSPRLEIAGDTLELFRDEPLARWITGCDVGADAAPGLWGVGAVGGDAGAARVDVQLVTVQRGAPNAP